MLFLTSTVGRWVRVQYRTVGSLYLAGNEAAVEDRLGHGNFNAHLLHGSAHGLLGPNSHVKFTCNIGTGINLPY